MSLYRRDTSSFYSPSTLVYGPGALGQLAAVALRHGISKPLLVTDPGIRRAGILDAAVQCLSEGSLDAEIFDGVQPDPTLENVNDGLEVYRETGCDGLIAVGGGSAIDCAKAISVARANPEELSSFTDAESIPTGGPPLIAVPTTAGTGSEMTRVMVITNTETNTKMMFLSRFCMPRAAIIDPDLTVSLPQSITAITGVDALSHAIEAFVSRRAQPLTDSLALSAVRRLSTCLRRAWVKGDDLEARYEVMLGAAEAGLAFSNSSVALVHGMARPLGAYFHLPHGVCIAAVLPVVTEFSYKAAIERYALLAQAMGEDVEGLSQEEAASKVALALEKLNQDLAIQPLPEHDIDHELYHRVIGNMADDALASGSPANNPRTGTREEIVQLFLRINPIS